MSEQVDFKVIERRTRQAYYADGLLEIMIGVYVFLVGVLSINGISPSLSVLLLFVVLLAMRIAKQRFVFPRTGYVNLPDDETQNKQDVWGAVKVVGGVLLALSAVALIFFWLWGDEQGREYLYFRFVPIFVGGLFAVALFVMARQNGVARWYAVGSWFLLQGLWMPLVPAASFEKHISEIFTCKLKWDINIDLLVRYLDVSGLSGFALNDPYDLEIIGADPY